MVEAQEVVLPGGVMLSAEGDGCPLSRAFRVFLSRDSLGPHFVFVVLHLLSCVPYSSGCPTAAEGEKGAGKEVSHLFLRDNVS